MNNMLLSLQSRFSALSSWLLMAIFAAMSSPAWAQAEELRPPRAKEAPSSPKFLMMGIIVVLLAIVVVVVTLKVKRTHQD
jgi:hypothetical protein